MTVIGITGPTGSGKTTALDVLKTMGFTVLDCDALYYRLLREDRAFKNAIIAEFGDVFLPGGDLDRKKLAACVFGDGKALAKLNKIVYPVIDSAVAKEIEATSGRGVVIDAINLIESGIAKRCDVVLGISAPPETRLKRIMARDGIDEDYAKRRMAAQKEDRFYKKHCTYFLSNEAGTPKEFSRLVKEFMEDILFMEES